SGALMVRPSRKITVSTVSLTRTSATRGSRIAAEMFMPSLKEVLLLFYHFCLDDAQFTGGKADVARHRNGFQPKLYRVAALIDMNVRRFKSLIAEKVEPVAGPSQHGWHGYSRFRPLAASPSR